MAAAREDIPPWLRTILNFVAIIGVGATLMGLIQKETGEAIIGVALLYFGWEFYPWAREQVNRRPQVSLVIFMFLGACLGVGVWYALKRAPASPPTGTVDEGVQISMLCESVGLPVSYSGDIYMLTTFGSGGIGRLSTGTKKEGFWPEEGVKGFGYKCTLKNYGAKTAFGVSFPVTVTEFEWVQLEPAMWGDGKQEKEYTFEASIPTPLGPQGSDQFSFYVCSFDTERSLKVKLPLTGFINSDDPKNKREVVVRIASPINPLPVSAKLPRIVSVSHEDAIPRITAESFPEKPGSSQYDSTPGASVLVTALTTYRNPVLEMECNVPCTFVAGLSFFQGKHVSGTMLEELPALPDSPNLIRIKMLMPVKLEIDEQLTLQFRSKDNRELAITNVRPHLGKL